MWLGDIAPEAEYELRYKFIPYISPPILDSQTLTFYINGTKLGEQSYDNKSIRELGIDVPGRLFSPNALNSFAIGVKSPISPDKYQQTPVKERVGLGIELGLGLIAFRVSRKDV